ncbi:hypothetical protein Hanom_Chr00s000002g01599301 [Helianthus anomalus]
MLTPITYQTSYTIRHTYLTTIRHHYILPFPSPIPAITSAGDEHLHSSSSVSLTHLYPIFISPIRAPSSFSDRPTPRLSLFLFPEAARRRDQKEWNERERERTVGEGAAPLLTTVVALKPHGDGDGGATADVLVGKRRMAARKT